MVSESMASGSVVSVNMASASMASVRRGERGERGACGKRECGEREVEHESEGEL